MVHFAAKPKILIDFRKQNVVITKESFDKIIKYTICTLGGLDGI